jgi:predicted amidohydrolase
LKIGIIQYDVAYKDIHKNTETIKKYVNDGDADLYVTPELALTGYLFSNKTELAKLIENTDDIITELSLLCKNKNTSIVLGHAKIENDAIFNTAFVIDGNGLLGTYNKIYLSKIEKPIFTAGFDIPVFNVKGVKIGINICNDLLFPELSSALLQKGVQLICCPCNFGGTPTLGIVRTRSLENKVFYAMSNRIGRENINGIDAHFRGESRVIDYNGNLILEFDDQQGLKTCIVNENDVIKNETILQQSHP